MTKAKLTDLAEMRQYPSLQQWLRVVGLTQESIQVIMYRNMNRFFTIHMLYNLVYVCKILFRISELKN